MTREEAIRILDPETTGEALAEIEYYGGFSGRAAVVHAVLDACVLAVAAIREQEERDNRIESDAVKNEPLTLDEMREMDGEPVWLKIAGGVLGLVDMNVSTVWLDRGGDIDLAKIAGLAYRSKPKEDDE